MSGRVGVTDFATGSSHSALLLEDGTVWTSGLNRRGQLLRDTTITDDRVENGDANFSPVDSLSDALSPGVDVVKVALGEDYTLILLSNGTLLGGGR